MIAQPVRVTGKWFDATLGAVCNPHGLEKKQLHIQATKTAYIYYLLLLDFYINVVRSSVSKLLILPLCNRGHSYSSKTQNSFKIK